MQVHHKSTACVPLAVRKTLLKNISEMLRVLRSMPFRSTMFFVHDTKYKIHVCPKNCSFPPSHDLLFFLPEYIKTSSSKKEESSLTGVLLFVECSNNNQIPKIWLHNSVAQPGGATDLPRIYFNVVVVELQEYYNIPKHQPMQKNNKMWKNTTLQLGARGI